MTERINRRELLIDTAAKLFLKQGYAETSVRQIAEAAEVTEAALYYHFKDGKRELFEHAMEQIAPDFAPVIEACEGAKTLRELVFAFGQEMMPHMAVSGRLMQWVAVQMQNAAGDESAIILDRLESFHEKVAAALGRFLLDSSKSTEVAWTLIVTAFGYGYVFGAVRMAERSSFGAQDLLNLVMQVVEKYES